MINDKSIKTVKECGATLVEVVITVVFLLLIVLATAAFFYYSAGHIKIESNKKIAIEIANARIEELRAADYANDITPIGPYPSRTYLTNQNGLWVKDTNETAQILTINDMDMPIKTIVQYVDAINNYLLVSVSVGYRGEDSAEVVTLDTYIGPS